MAIRCTPCEDIKKKKKENPSPSKGQSKYKVEWTGECPCKYLGEWKIYKNNNDVTFLLPTALRNRPAYTYGEYPVWEEQPFDTYVQQYVTDGCHTPEWIQANLYWLVLVGDNPEDFLAIYNAFHEKDFRTSRWM